MRPGRLAFLVALLFFGPGPVAAATADRPTESVAVASDSARGTPAPVSAADSAVAPGDSAKANVVAKRSLPARTLTLRQQVMFAGGFMAFVALMMTSMQNFNP